MTETIAVLGSTGSVGTQALDVAAFHGIRVTAIAGGHNVRLLEEQVRHFRPALCGVADEKAAEDLRVRIADTGTRIVAGRDAAAQIAAEADAQIAVNAVTGIAGLRPTLAAIESGKHVALANKETMVAFGEQVMALAREKGVRILPVDSEHCAVFQCLQANPGRAVRRILLTASGGPFFGKTKEELSRVTVAQTLAHPTWRMGRRITVDSATLMNKGFEVIEAVRLFGVSPSQIEVVVHRESIIHSMVEYIDRAVIAQMSVPDMRLCVQYALSYPDRWESPLTPLDFPALGALTFSSPDTDTFPLLALAFEAVGKGGVAPAVMNAADEVAVGAFLSGEISLPALTELVTRAVRTCTAASETLPTLAEVEAADRETRGQVREQLRRKEVLCGQS